ncbi:MAG: Stk1 family PASTA domain-containing Ser/Thr kinase [Firmicutes bacterium]|nr:Stk1 family PASTA domain-containing Ser/Thr kinase [Bacillota bacterium]
MSKKVLAGRYELLERRGNGGMAVVYKGKDCLLNRYVAIKILRPEYIKDPKFVDNFRRESQAAARLTDPNIVSVYDVGREGNIYYIVMELMDGSSLGDIIQAKAPLSEKETIKISREIASGLSSAHKKKIVHRDIKPHNILMSEDGTAKIADFGIAKAVSGATVVNSTTTVMGSVHYLSPEQARGGFVDARTDIYSLGIVMFEMLTGRVPFDGENAVSVAMMHLNNDVPAPSRFNPSVSRMMDNIVKKAAARNPGERYESADELIEALDKAAREAANPSADRGRAYGLNEFYAVDPAREQFGDGYGGGERTETGINRSLPPGESAQPKKKAKSRDNESASKKARKRKKKKKNSSRKVKVLGIILALVCAIPLSMLLLHALGTLGDDTVAIPDVLGMTEQQAAEKLQDKGLEYELGTSVYSNKYEEGEVCNIEPEAGTHVKEGYTVTLRLARESASKADDSEKVKVPDVRKKTLSKARTLITDEGLKVGDVSYEYSDSVQEGSVISQDPGAGEKVKSGSAVKLTVSRGEEKENVTVPDLMGMTKAEASEALEKLGLSVGDVTQEYSDSDVGTVVRQGVKAGTSVEPGSKVNISISKGSSSSSKNTDTDNGNSDSGKKSGSSDSSSGNSGNDSGNSDSSSGSSGNSSGSSGSSSGSSGSSSGSSGSSSGSSGSSSSNSGSSSGSSGSSSGSSGSSSGSSGSGSGSSGNSSGGSGSSSGNSGSSSGHSNSGPQDGVVDD